MPENETLLYDARSASRWRPVGDRIDGGQAPTDLFPEIQDHFYSSLQKVWKQWKSRGVEPRQLFQAALTNSQAMRNYIKQMSFDRNAQLLRDVAVDIQVADMGHLIPAFLNAVWDDVESQLQLNRHEEVQSLEFIGMVNQMLSRIASSLAINQSRFPNKPSRNEPPPDLDTQLDQNLL